MLRKGKEVASPPSFYSLSPVPSPNGTTPPSLPQGERRSLIPNPSPNGEGVNTTISKQRGRFFTSKRRPLHCKETPSSMRRERSFNFKILLPLFLSGIGIRVNDSIYSPSSFSERGGGEASLRRRRIPPIMLHALH